MKKIICAFIIFSVLTIGSCGDDKSYTPSAATSEPSEEITTQEEIYEADVPEQDFEGYEFRFLTNDHSSLTWAYTVMNTEEVIGEPINDAVYQRNRFIEEKYNIKIKEITKPFGQVSTTAVKSIAAGADDYDVIIEDIRYTIPLITQNYLLSVDDIPYIDTSKPWWDKNVERDLKITDRLYYLGGDYSLAHYDTTCALMFNKNLIEQYQLGNPYELVKSGKWTFDEFEKMIKSVSEDLDGDQKYTEADRYGFSSLSFVFYPSFMMGANARSVILDTEHNPKYVLGDDYTSTVFNRLNEMMHIGNTSYDVIPKGKEHRLPEYMFAEDKVLFWSQLIYWTTQLRDMKSDFGIIPYPKFQESQKEYNVLVFAPPLTMIPTTNTDLTRTGIILEAMAAKSREELIPAYYETTMKNKISRDDETMENLDIIYSSRSYDITATYWSFIDDGLIKLFEKNSSELSSYSEKTLDKANAEIQKIIDAINMND